jgi:acyl-CoA thioesterase YciA
MAEPYLALQVVMMPRDANPNFGVVAVPGIGQYPLYNTIFGGVLLANIDMAGAIGAQHAVQIAGGNPNALFVTVAINRVEFKKPVLVGDVVKFLTSVEKVGRTSITIHIDVLAERGAEEIHVTEAEVVFVGVDRTSPERKPVPLFPD